MVHIEIKEYCVSLGNASLNNSMIKPPADSPAFYQCFVLLTLAGMLTGLGLVGNVSAFAIFRHRFFANPPYPMLKILALMDTGICLTTFADIIIHTWFHLYRRSTASCLYRIAIWHLTVWASQNSLFLMRNITTLYVAMSRFGAIAGDPLTWPRSVLQTKRTLIMACIVVLSVVLSIPRLFDLRTTICLDTVYLVWQQEGAAGGWRTVYSLVVNIGLQYGLPLSMTVALNIALMRHIHAMQLSGRVGQGRLDPSSRPLYSPISPVAEFRETHDSLPSTCFLIDTNRTTQVGPRATARDRRTRSNTIIVVCLSFLFILCETPVFIDRLLVTVLYRLDWDQYVYFVLLSNMASLINSGSNFAVYYTFNPRFRLICGLLKPCSKRRSTSFATTVIPLNQCAAAKAIVDDREGGKQQDEAKEVSPRGATAANYDEAAALNSQKATMQSVWKDMEEQIALLKSNKQHHGSRPRRRSQNLIE